MTQIRRIIAVALVALAAPGCGPEKLDLTTDAQQRMRYRDPKDRGNWLSPAQAVELMQTAPDLQVLCVGTIEDYRQGHLPQSMLIPVTALRMVVGDDTKNTLYQSINRGRKPVKDRPLLVYCWWNKCKCPTVPTYSRLARKVLREKGYAKVYSIEGGMMAWKEAGLSYEKGEPPLAGEQPER